MPQDTVWTGEYQKIIERENNDTSAKQINIKIGYVALTDFGVAKLYQKENSSETSGTPGYMAPEVMCAQNHTIAVDYFALGVIGYEFINNYII